MVGRKPKVNDDEFVECVQRYSDCFLDISTCAVQSQNNDIWKEMSAHLNGRWDPKTVYLHVFNNYHGILNKLGRSVKNRTNVEIVDEPASIPDDDDDSNIVDEMASTSNDDVNEDKLTFDLKLGMEQWLQIQPIEKVYGRIRLRKELVLQPGQWTSVIHDHFWNATKLVCAVVYDYARVHEYGANYVKIAGHCKNCHSRLSGNLLTKPTDDQSHIVINCEYAGNFKICTPGVKRRVTKKMKDHFLKALVTDNISASVVRDLYADEVMEFGDAEPAHIPRPENLRSLKSRHLNITRLDRNPIIAISELKFIHPYETSIMDIGLSRFFVHYFTPAELNCYREYFKQNDCPTICIDATGSLVKRPSIHCGTVLLYDIVCNDKIAHSQFTAGHMLSERHDSDSITYWLQQWLRMNIPSPKQVVTDLSLALLAAVVNTFTPYDTLWAYIEGCYDMMNGELELRYMPCLIRCDVAHIMKIISWKPFKNVDSRVKKFICRAMGQIILSRSFDEMKDILRNIFWMVNSETRGIGNITSTKTICELAIDSLKYRISHGENDCDIQAFLQVYNEAQEQEGEVIFDDLNVYLTHGTDRQTTNRFYVAIRDLSNQCVDNINNQNEDGQLENIFYLPDIVPYILNLVLYLPLWSGLMVELTGFGTIPPSSAPVESNFANLKRRVFENERLPIRVDDFLQLHLNAISGKTKIQYSRLLYNTCSSTSVIMDGKVDDNVNTLPRNCSSAVRNVNPSSSAHTAEVNNDLPVRNVSPLSGQHFMTFNRPKLPAFSNLKQKKNIQKLPGKRIRKDTQKFPGKGMWEQPAKKKNSAKLTDFNVWEDLSSEQDVDNDFSNVHAVQELVVLPDFLNISNSMGCGANVGSQSEVDVSMGLDESVGTQPEVDVLKGFDENVGSQPEVDVSIDFDENTTIASESERDLSAIASVQQTNTSMGCPACELGDQPDGNLQCTECHRPIHRLEKCSLLIGTSDEVSKERRICINCLVSIDDESEVKTKLVSTKNSASERNKLFQREAEEGWQRRKSNAKIRKSSSYLSVKPEIMYERYDTKSKIRTIGLLRNGSCPTFKPFTVDKQDITVNNSSGFDSLTQILMVAACDSNIYSSFTKRFVHHDNYIKFIWNTLTKGVHSNTYTERYRIMRDLKCTEIDQGSFLILDGDCIAENLITNLLHKYCSAVITCKKCNNGIEQQLVFQVNCPGMSPKQATCHVLQALFESTFQEWIERSNCVHCGSGPAKDVALLNRIFFSIATFDDQDPERKTRNTRIRLSNVPTKLRLHGKQYHLRGIISVPAEHTILKNSNLVTHYSAHCYREPLNIWELYDDLKKKPSCPRYDVIVLAEILVYTE